MYKKIILSTILLCGPVFGDCVNGYIKCKQPPKLGIHDGLTGGITYARNYDSGRAACVEDTKQFADAVLFCIGSNGQVVH